jgi:transposase
MGRADLERLSKEELIELVLRLQRPAKTSRTSSKPPSTDRKERRDKARPGGAKPGHEGHSRALAEDPDRIIDHRPACCTSCGLALPPDLPAETVSTHEHIELPPVRPIVEQHRRMAVTCPACRARVAAPRPAGADATPFGPRLHATAVYLKTFQALSYERLQTALSDLFGLTVSQGGLMSMLRRAEACFASGREAALSALRRAAVVACDETGVRIEGANSYHWVFRCDEAVVHHAAPTRAASVVREIMDGHRPAVWLSDRYSAQQGHADAQQTCLAHLARDVAYAVEAGDDPLAFRLELWFGSAFALARRIGNLAASTIQAKRRTLEREFDAILSAPVRCDLAREIRNRMRRARDQLLTFASFPGRVEATNNACERDLRPAVIQRKNTNGYRAMWSAQGEAAVRTVVATAWLQPGASTFAILLGTIRARAPALA